MKQYRLTLLGLGVSMLLYAFLVVFDVDLFEKVHGFLENIERFEVDELVFPLSIFIAVAFVDNFKKRKALQIELEKIKIYKAMLASTHHILNNFLNQMQLFKMTAESTPDFDPEVLSLYDHIIKEATTQIDALGSIAEIDEASIRASWSP